MSHEALVALEEAAPIPEIGPEPRGGQAKGGREGGGEHKRSDKSLRNVHRAPLLTTQAPPDGALRTSRKRSSSPGPDAPGYPLRWIVTL